ncbi:hypothetical protein F4679DRAFT_592919 [Xylaria curta]|nr:hypothetical protein F4679DRAFT_592919 [Xylaria curta]
MSSHNSTQKARVFGLKRRALVYNSTFDFHSIEIDDDVKKGEYSRYWQNKEKSLNIYSFLDSRLYWSFQLGPPRTPIDQWDLFWDERTDQYTAVAPGQPQVDGIFIAGLRLRKLGVWARTLRKAGVLNNGYVMRPHTHLNKTSTGR